MQRQYDPQKAHLEHKAQICAKFHKRKSNSFRTVVRKWKSDEIQILISDTVSVQKVSLFIIGLTSSQSTVILKAFGPNVIVN